MQARVPLLACLTAQTQNAVLTCPAGEPAVEVAAAAAMVLHTPPQTHFLAALTTRTLHDQDPVSGSMQGESVHACVVCAVLTVAWFSTRLVYVYQYVQFPPGDLIVKPAQTCGCPSLGASPPRGP
jgi:hypothetical protein